MDQLNLNIERAGNGFTCRGGEKNQLNVFTTAQEFRDHLEKLVETFIAETPVK